MDLTEDEEARIAELAKVAAEEIRCYIALVFERYRRNQLDEVLHTMAPSSGLMRANYSGSVYGAFEDGLAGELGTQWSWLVPEREQGREE